MYRAALIQNESEMMRYGWADIRPMITGINYEWVSFTIDRLPELFAELTLGRYDGIVIATNACNDKNVRNVLQEKRNKRALSEFLEKGGGLFVSFQMRLTQFDSYQFLPEQYDVRAINRKELGVEGNLAFSGEYKNHILFKYPHPVRVEQIAEQSLHNEFARSLYRGFLEPINNEIYNTLLIDDAYTNDRSLLLCSKENFAGRVVLTSLPLDWQGHQRLLENVVRYVVEGQPRIAVVEKHRETEFDFQYLVANLEVTKVPFSRYVQTQLDFSKMLLSIHDTIILDPGWTYNDLIKSNYSSYSEEFYTRIRLFFFGQTESEAPILSRMGGTKSIQLLIPKTVIWLKSQYKNGRWGGSFWHTFDVVEVLVGLGIPIDEYQEEIINGIEPHNIEGSYDEVIGATCALLKIYKIFLGQEHEKFKESQEWLQEMLARAGLYEQASTIDTFNEVGIQVDQQVLLDFRARTKSLLPSLDDELRLFRYAKTLLSSGYVKEAYYICLKLADYQSTIGSWVNVARTSSIISLLIHTQQQLGNPSREIDDMIFKGVTYLKSTYNFEDNNWHEDVPSTAKALRAIVEFEKLVSYPIDELIQTLQGFHKFSSEYKALETAAAQNAKLQKDKSELKNKLEKSSRINSFSTKLATILAVITTPVLTLLLFLLFYSIQNDDFSKFWGYFTGFIQDQTLALSTSLSLIPISILYLILRAFDTIPRLKLVPEEWEDAILHRLLKLQDVE
jgi:hypothetical protein